MATIKGVLQYADNGDHPPIVHFRVVLRGNDASGNAGDLSSTTTDRDGSFVFEGVVGTPTEVVGCERFRTYNAAGAPQDEYRDAFEIPLPAGETNLGTQRVPFWGYRSDRPVPRAGLNAEGKTDQQHATGYLESLGKAVGAIRPILVGLMGRLKNGEKLTIAEIQSEYPEGLTSRIDRFANHSHSDAWLGELVLNGFNTAPLQRATDGTDRLAMIFDWGEVRSDGVHDLSNVVAYFEVRNGKLFPVEIETETLSPSSATEWKGSVRRTAQVKDAGWEDAKHIFRCQYLLSGALEAHIIKTHLVVEQYCIAAYRNLRNNPVRDLILPHLQEVVAADTDADDFAWGPQGQIPQGSVLKFADDVEPRMKHLLGQMDWRGWSPRTPVSVDHKYARLLSLYWELIGTYVDEYIEQHLPAIEADWDEIRRFSDDLHRRSAERAAQDPRDGFRWRCMNEIAIPGERDGGGRAVSPITRSPTATLDGVERLKELCRYLLCQATFIHTWVHQGQYDVGGDMFFASLSLRNGSIGGLDVKGPLPAEAITGLFINSNGRQVNFGFLMENEAEDVPPRLRELLTERASQFAALGFDVKRIRSRINI